MEMATIQAFAAQVRLPADLDRRMRLLVEHGHPESMLRKHALEYDCDLTVIGAFRRGLAFHLLVGGTTRRIVQVAPSDVLVVRASEQARSEEHTSELQSLMRISYAVFCLKKKKTHKASTCIT